MKVNPRLPKGVVTTPFDIFSCCIKSQKKLTPGHFNNCKFILCGHFDEKYSGVTRQSSGVGGLVATPGILKLPFVMKLKLTEYGRIAISLIHICKKPGDIAIFRIL